MKYMLMIYMDENALSQTEREECYVDSAQLARNLHTKGKYLGAAPLYPVSTATTLKVRAGERIITDGPFAETREQFGGFFMVEVKDLDEAISIAEQIPGARVGTVEIRPVYEIPGLPSEAAN
jgi:hypothetical protein